MLESIEVKNYKVLDRIKVEGFSNINVFVGANNCGKTSLLEAMILNCIPTDPHIIVTLISNIIRSTTLDDGNLDIFFNQLDINKDIEISSNNKDMVLKIKPRIKDSYQIEQNNQINATLNQHIKDVNGRNIIGLDFEAKSNNKDVKKTYFELDGTKITNYKKEYYQCFSAMFIPVNYNMNIIEIISLLRIQKKEQQLIEYMQIFDKNIIGIEVIGNDVMVDLEYMPKKASWNIMGGGFKRYLFIIASVVLGAYKYLFVDEIENGLHFESTKKLIESIIELCKQTNIQLFISTHSYEFLEILSSVALDKAYKNIAVFNIKQTKLKGLQAYRYDMVDLDNLISTETEIRR